MMSVSVRSVAILLCITLMLTGCDGLSEGQAFTGMFFFCVISIFFPSKRRMDKDPKKLGSLPSKIEAFQRLKQGK